MTTDPLEADGPDPVAGVQVSMTLDLWMAMGLESEDFHSYYERNGYADTWSTLLGRIRTPLPCGKPVDGESCVLAPHSDAAPCYGPSDVGHSEPLPHLDGAR